MHDGKRLLLKPTIKTRGFPQEPPATDRFPQNGSSPPKAPPPSSQHSWRWLLAWKFHVGSGSNGYRGTKETPRFGKVRKMSPGPTDLGVASFWPSHETFFVKKKTAWLLKELRTFFFFWKHWPEERPWIPLLKGMVGGWNHPTTLGLPVPQKTPKIGAIVGTQKWLGLWDSG